jgi:hypothetical protein
MAESRSEPIELRRADSGYDLWPAVEAAQYARLVEHVEPHNGNEAGRIEEFVDCFSDCSERWEERSSPDQAIALEQLSHRVVALEELGLSVYWAVMERSFDTADGGRVDMPIAVLAISRDDRPSIVAELPTAVTVE